MITDRDIERRCRYRLRLHGLKVHKTRNDYNTPIYCVYNEDEDWRDHIDDDYAWYNLDNLLNLCETLAEKDEVERYERRYR